MNHKPRGGDRAEDKEPQTGIRVPAAHGLRLRHLQSAGGDSGPGGRSAAGRQAGAGGGDQPLSVSGQSAIVNLESGTRRRACQMGGRELLRVAFLVRGLALCQLDADCTAELGLPLDFAVGDEAE